LKRKVWLQARLKKSTPQKNTKSLTASRWKKLDAKDNEILFKAVISECVD
jgi:hypothetical protein